jgi:hypothetical protein
MKRHHVIAAIGALFLVVMAWQPDRPAPVYVTPQPAPVVYAAAPEQEPAPAYALDVEVLKVEPFSTVGTNCDMGITNRSPYTIKLATLEMQYKDANNNYLGSCNVQVANLAPNAVGIGQAHMGDTLPEQLAHYDLRIRFVIGQDGYITDEFYIPEASK